MLGDVSLLQGDEKGHGMKQRFHGITVGCIRCGKLARWIVLNFPLCDDCVESVEKVQKAQKSQ